MGYYLGGGGGYYLDGIVPVLCRLLCIAVTMADVALPSIMMSSTCLMGRDL